jgi:hypothetical protein
MKTWVHMASPAADDMHGLETLRFKLAELPGAERVLSDEGGGLVIVCRSGAQREQLRVRIGEILAEAGVSDETQVDIVVRPEDEPRRRIRFAAIDISSEPVGLTRVRVTLEWGGVSHYGESVGESGHPLELRTAAAAAVMALNRVTADSIAVRLVGVKQVRAFDADILVVALMSEESPPQKLVGAVLASDAPHRAAAAAVLHATNRLLGNYIAV